MHSTEAAVPYTITNVFVSIQHAISRREAWRPYDAVAGLSIGHSKHHHQKTTPKMGITTAMIHCTTTDFEYQGVDFRPYKDFIQKKLGIF